MRERALPPRTRTVHRFRDACRRTQYPKSAYWEEVLTPAQGHHRRANTMVPDNRARYAEPVHLCTNVHGQSVAPAGGLWVQGDAAVLLRESRETTLSTGPPYGRRTLGHLYGCVSLPGVRTCPGEEPSPIWSALGQDDAFIALLTSRTGMGRLAQDYDAVRTLYEAEPVVRRWVFRPPRSSLALRGSYLQPRQLRHAART